MKRRLRVGILVSLAVVCLLSAVVDGNVLLQFSRTLGGGAPFYARIEMLQNGEILVHNDGEWAAIAFYRDPDIVPPAFNLLELFDSTLDVMSNAARESLTVEGFEIWRIAPWEEGAGSAPIQVVSHGLGAVPIWFVRMTELQSAFSDGVLTKVELDNLPSLQKGSAIYFKETLHPSGGPGGDSLAAQQTKTQIAAYGSLETGGSFFFQVEETHDQLKHVVIQFK